MVSAWLQLGVSLASAWRQLGVSLLYFNKPQSDGTSFDGLLLRRMDRPRSAKGANFNYIPIIFQRRE